MKFKREYTEEELYPIRAIFRPKITSDLEPEVYKNIGKEIRVRPEWIADENYSSGRYSGQRVYSICHASEFGAASVPFEDLEFIE